MTITPELIGLILSGIGGAFLFFGVFWGLVRGLKKSLFRGIWLIALALIIFFLTPTISRALCNLDLSFLGVKVENATPSLFGAIRESILGVEGIADIADKNPSLIPMIEQLIILVINLIVFPISFWIAKIVTYPIWAIISAIVFRKKKTVVNGKKMRVKTKKYRLVGMLVGAVSSVMVMVVTLMPLSGTINLIKKIDSMEYSNSKDGEGLVTAVAGEEVMEYVDTSLLLYTPSPKASSSSFCACLLASLNDLPEVTKFLILAYLRCVSTFTLMVVLSCKSTRALNVNVPFERAPLTSLKK